MTFLQIIFFTISQASFISAASISADRSYAICWPLKHRTLSTRTSTIGHLTVWKLAILFSKLFLLIPEAAHALFKSFCLVLTISRGLNIGIWRKFQKKTIHCNQNRAMHANPTFNESVVVCICCYSEFFDAYSCVQLNNPFLDATYLTTFSPKSLSISFLLVY